MSRRTRRLLLALLIPLIGLGLGYAWIAHDLPPLERLSAGLALPSTRLYDRHGALLYEISAPQSGRNTPIALDEVPPHCVNAFIATEDANYWSHPGVDPLGLLRALWINLRGGEVLAGGSTITQQTARLLLLDPLGQSQRTLERKLKEMVLALRLQAALSKEEVLALYLNQVYFGNLAYGLEAAARAYFGKEAQALSLAECALLAGLVQNATWYDPLRNPQRAKERQGVVLRLMTQAGYISPEQAASAERDLLQYGASPFPIRAPHFVMSAWAELEATYGPLLTQEGLDVYTTLDAEWQDMAQDIARRQLAYLNLPNNPQRAAANARNAALVALDPRTGEVLTLLGSPDYFDESIDGAVNVALALRQPGSALKPFTYAAAFDPTQPDPYTPASVVLDVRTPFVTRKLESYTPSNYALVEHGPTSIREALASSYNIPAVVALEKVGLGRFAQLMADLGMESLARNTEVDLSITLGGGEVRLLDLTRAYGILANGGQWLDVRLIQRVVRRSDGAVLYAAPTEPQQGRRVLDERVAYLITDILSDNSARLPAFGLNSPLNIGRPAAAKTGTTTDFRDNWIVGYTPDLVVGVWVGNADNAPMQDVTGVSGAGPIWNLFMRRALVGQTEQAFTRPAGLIELEVCALSGLLPTPDCPRTRREWFIDGTQPTEPDHFYQRFAVDARTGLLADETTPPEQRIERVYVVLPQEARDWGARNGLIPPPQGAPLALTESDTALRLLSPDPYTIFELSPILPTGVQRLRFTVGAPPDTARVDYWLNGELIGESAASPWVVWWPLALGDYTLEARATLADGTQVSSAPVPFRVVEEPPPGSYTLGG